MKKTLFTLALSFILFSCGNNSNKNDTAVEAEKEAVKLTVSELIGNPDNYIGQKIIVSGTVDHVCKNSGKKMFILGENPENRLKITTGEAISVFEVDLEGSDVTVEGIFTELRMNEEYLAIMEEELKKEEKEHAEHNESVSDTHDSDGADEGEHANEGEHSEGTDQITALRDKIKESEKGYISEFSVECISYSEKTK